MNIRGEKTQAIQETHTRMIMRALGLKCSLVL